MPLTLSLILLTGFVSLRNFSPDASRNNIAFASICSFSRFLTHIAFSRPLIYVPFITGCFRGRGETVISTCGFAAANLGRVCRRKALEDQIIRTSCKYAEQGIVSLLHAFRAASPVAVVEVKPFTLKDESTDAVLER